MSPPEHLHEPLTGQHLTIHQTGRDTSGALLEIEVRLDRGGRVPRHAHLRQDERVTVLEGSIVVRVGRLERNMAVGDAIVVPRRTVHAVRNAGDARARFVLEVRPARRMQAAMRALFAGSRAVAPMVRMYRRAADRDN